ncbi:MAG TPA: acyl-CoA dehydrogenase family protein, partial [Thermomicrobiales bacterium]|nr:acyl-CoA dehydrogenase family protein [Thermomicrobiales bacterium]
MDFAENPAHRATREAVRALCARFPDAYWRDLDARREYPEDFVRALTAAGWLAALIPTEYGGKGLSLTEASLILEEINHCGGNAGPAHAQMYIMGTLLRHGSAEQKRRYLPALAAGDLRLQAFGVTEPGSGSDTTALTTYAERRGERYVINGRKIYISRAQHSDLLLLLARTTPLAERGADRTRGLSLFLVDLRAAGDAITLRRLPMLMNNETNELTIENLEVPAENLVGEEGGGFRAIVDGWNAERTLIAAECIGDGRWFVERATRYAGQRVVFGRPIGQNQGVQFPLARAHAALAAADLL